MRKLGFFVGEEYNLLTIGEAYESIDYFIWRGVFNWMF